MRIGRLVLCAVLAVVAVTLLAAPALATRVPTQAEIAAIKRAIKAYDWDSPGRVKISYMCISTQNTRYAISDVTFPATGVGGGVVLKRTDSTWRIVYVGTDFTDTGVPRKVLRDLLRGKHCAHFG
jgi:hypothetical protein